jgi:hypothetical protein
MKSLATRAAIAQVKAARAAAVGFNAPVECPPPGVLKYAAATVTVPAGGTATARVVTPGTFCPVTMYLVSDDLELILVSSIHVGLEEQIVNRQPVTGITGVLPATMFSIENHCCPTKCLPCLCVPEVPFEVDLYNTDVTPEDVTVVLVGTYLENCLEPVQSEPCYEKYVGFVVALSPAETESISITTPGRFCPRYMFLQADRDFAVIDSIMSGLKEQIISGSIRASLFTVDNKCCIFACFDCLCMPGYPLKITFRNTDAEGPVTLFGALVGTYEDACP